MTVYNPWSQFTGGRTRGQVPSPFGQRSLASADFGAPPTDSSSVWSKLTGQPSNSWLMPPQAKPGTTPDYAAQAQAAFKPFQQAAIRAQKGALADSGLLRSTAGAGSIGQVAAEWQGRMKDWAEQRRQYDQGFAENQRQFDLGIGEQRRQNDQGFGENQRQFNENLQAQQEQFRAQFDENAQRFGVETALRIWEMQMSAALSREQLSGSTQGIQYPDQQAWWTNLWNQNFIPPQQATGQQGDPPDWVTIPSHTEDRRNLASDQEARIAADADAQMGLERERLNLQKQMWQAEMAKGEETDDPWSLARDAARENRSMGLLAPGTNQEPTSFIKSLQVDGLDVLGEIQSNGPNALKAEAIIYSLYSAETAEKIIARLRGTAEPGKTPWAVASHEPTAPAAQSQWDSFIRGNTSAPAYGRVGVPREQFPMAGPNPFRR